MTTSPTDPSAPFNAGSRLQASPEVKIAHAANSDPPHASQALPQASVTQPAKPPVGEVTVGPIERPSVNLRLANLSPLPAQEGHPDLSASIYAGGDGGSGQAVGRAATSAPTDHDAGHGDTVRPSTVPNMDSYAYGSDSEGNHDSGPEHRRNASPASPPSTPDPHPSHPPNPGPQPVDSQDRLVQSPTDSNLELMDCSVGGRAQTPPIKYGSDLAASHEPNHYLSTLSEYSDTKVHRHRTKSRPRHNGPVAANNEPRFEPQAHNRVAPPCCSKLRDRPYADPSANYGPSPLPGHDGPETANRELGGASQASFGSRDQELSNSALTLITDADYANDYRRRRSGARRSRPPAAASCCSSPSSSAYQISPDRLPPKQRFEVPHVDAWGNVDRLPPTLFGPIAMNISPSLPTHLARASDTNFTRHYEPADEPADGGGGGAGDDRGRKVPDRTGSSSSNTAHAGGTHSSSAPPYVPTTTTTTTTTSGRSTSSADPSISNPHHADGAHHDSAPPSTTYVPTTTTTAATTITEHSSTPRTVLTPLSMFIGPAAAQNMDDSSDDEYDAASPQSSAPAACDPSFIDFQGPFRTPPDLPP